MNNIFDKFIEIRPIAVKGEPEAHSVYFKVGVQKFCISPQSCENKEHAEWFAGMFKKALANMLQEFGNLSPSPAPSLAARLRERGGYTMKCSYDGGTCGLGGYCKKCPYNQIELIKDLADAIAEKIPADHPYQKIAEQARLFIKEHPGDPAPADGVISTVTNCPTCGAECTVEGKTTHYYVPRTAPSAQWIPVSERLPERNSTVFYWHKGPNGGGSGWPAIADEWRDEHHLDYATHWMPLPPTPTTNTR